MSASTIVTSLPDNYPSDVIAFTTLALPAGRLIDEVQLVHTIQGK